MNVLSKSVLSVAVVLTTSSAFALSKAEVVTCAKADVVKVQAATDAQALSKLLGGLVSNALTIDAKLAGAAKYREQIAAAAAQAKAKNPTKVAEIDAQVKEILAEVSKAEAFFNGLKSQVTAAKTCAEATTVFEKLNAEKLKNADKSDVILMSEADFTANAAVLKELAANLGFAKVGETLSYKHHEVRNILISAYNHAQQTGEVPTTEQMGVEKDAEKITADQYEAKLFADRKKNVIESLTALAK